MSYRRRWFTVNLRNQYDTPDKERCSNIDLGKLVEMSDSQGLKNNAHHSRLPWPPFLAVVYYGLKNNKDSIDGKSHQGEQSKPVEEQLDIG